MQYINRIQQVNQSNKMNEDRNSRLPGAAWI